MRTMAGLVRLGWWILLGVVRVNQISVNGELRDRAWPWEYIKSTWSGICEREDAHKDDHRARAFGARRRAA